LERIWQEDNQKVDSEHISFSKMFVREKEGMEVGELLTRLGALGIGFLSMMGPLVLLMVFLRLRDQRESILYPMVLKELNSPDLRGLFAVKIRCRVFSGQDTVMVDLWNCTKEQVWDTVIRLSIHLPPEVRLVVNGMADSRSRSTLTLKVKRSIPSVSSVSCCR
jgi:hypothetical protein